MTHFPSQRKRWLFVAMAAAMAVLIMCVALLGIDIYLHSRFQKSAGVNIWGYRGPVVARKQPGELRVAFLGGSTAFGYGVSWGEAIPAQLEKGLNAQRAQGAPRATVLNLAYNNEGAYSFRFTLEDYQYLKYDIACLYEGYNDMMGDSDNPNTSVFRRDSPVFKLTGYLPIFPVIFREKAASLLYGGDLNSYYRQLLGETNKTVFHPGLANRTAAGALNATAAIEQSLEHQMAKAMGEKRRVIIGGDRSGCPYPWGQYCLSMFAAVDYALKNGARVLVVGQPHLEGQTLRERHNEQQATLVKGLATRYPGNPRVQYVSVGDSVDIRDPLVGYDHMHLTAPASAIVAAALVKPVVALAQVKP